ncbi:FkbM family methyltransferase [Pseudomonas protegens]|uniref:FkbM family methyltransferase n=1 Tax=Pseudomonas protegens TaxID=380021 RepID=UPI0015E7C5B3|nr:FkbM family methyltransferase [Pseudomonas protegens]
MELVQTKNIFSQKITVIKGDLIGRKILKHGAYDKTGLCFIDRLLPELGSPVCIDIGANIGNHVLVISRHAGNVFAFEPQPDVYKVLVKNLNDNEINNVRALPFGLSNWAGTARMSVVDSTNTGATSFVTQTNSVSSIEAELRHGDEEVKRLGISKVDFIKIDVEGLEPLVIEGLKNTITLSKPIIMIEWNSNATKDGFREKTLFTNLFAGYSVFSITSSHERPASGESWFQKIIRKIRRGFCRPVVRIGHFEEKQDYGNIVIVPSDKLDLVTKLFGSGKLVNI